ncbi:MAG: cell division protein FtsQ/DivIB [Prevotellaceae bacterium]|jgi:cell division protein FtsQ|nr:cell division protein FtsQ/DivIB [Prevotellaceae bacterium]
MKRIVKITLAAALAVAVVAAVAATMLHARREAEKVLCTGLRVVVADSAVNRFVRKEDIPAIFRRSGLSYFGRRVGELPTVEMEQALTKRSLIRHAEVYSTADGTLHVVVEQRRPVVRVFARNGQNFYIDDEGFIIRPYRSYTSNVPVASGHIVSPFGGDFTGSMLTFFEEKKKPDTLLRQLYDFARYISGHSFWQAQVEQIYVTDRGKVELVPRVGAHLIRMGSLDDFEYKLHKLEVMYEKGMSLDGWNAYDVIDLAFGRQVVCRRRELKAKN